MKCKIVHGKVFYLQISGFNVAVYYFNNNNLQKVLKMLFLHTVRCESH